MLKVYYYIKYFIVYLMLKYISSFKIKNLSRLSSSDEILCKHFRPSAIATPPSLEIRLLKKIFYIFNYCGNILIILK